MFITKTMSQIKNFLHEQEELEQEEFMSYLDWVQENKELFQQLPQQVEEEEV